MPAKDIIHEAVKQALIKDGWTITHDPLKVEVGEWRTFVDLGAERPLAADKGDRRIAVEIKSFVSNSPIADLEQAIGQYQIYSFLLARIEPERVLYLAVSDTIFHEIFQSQLGSELANDFHLKLISVVLETQEVEQWKD
jgi:hypothetical protein